MSKGPHAKSFDDYLEFPGDPPLEQAPLFGEAPDFGDYSSAGMVRHKVRRGLVLRLCDIDLGFTESPTGYSARQLGFSFSDDDWLFERNGVLDAHGWVEGPVQISVSLVERLKEVEGPDFVVRARERFGEDWTEFALEVAAAHFARPLSRLWYVANLTSLYCAHQDDVRFGYLLCEYEARLRHESNATRGQKTVASAQAGGHAKSIKGKTRRANIVNAVARYIQAGHSKSRAGELAFNAGLGSSGPANVKLFDRWSVKRDQTDK